MAALDEDNSPKSFEAVAKKYSIDEATKNTGGLREAVVEGQSEPALDEAIFSSPEGELVGPLEGDAGFYVLQVDDGHAGGDAAARPGRGCRPRPTPPRSAPATRSSRRWSPHASRRSPSASRTTSPRSGRRGRSAPRATRSTAARTGRRCRTSAPRRSRESTGCPAVVLSRPGRGARKPRGVRDADRGACFRRARSRRPPRAVGGEQLPPGLVPTQPGQAPPAHGSPRNRPLVRPGTRARPGRRDRPGLPPPTAASGSRSASALQPMSEGATGLRRARAARRDHPPAAGRVPVGSRAGRALDRPAHGRGGVRARRRGRGGDDERMLDELGDVLFQVVFLSLLLEERGAGSFAAVADGVTEKLIRRHPHVFEESEARDLLARRRHRDGERRALELGPDQARGRGPRRRTTRSADVPENLPGLLYARKILRRADPGGGAPPDRERRDEAEAAIGELLLDAVRVARSLGVDPELALRAAANSLRKGSGSSGFARYRAPGGRLDSRRSWARSRDPRTADPRLPGQPDGRGRRPPRQRRVRPRRGALRRLDRRVRGDRAPRRRRVVGRQGRDDRGRQRQRRDREGAHRRPRRRPDGDRHDPARARRHAEQVAARRQRDPRRLARGRPRRGEPTRACRSTPTSPSSTAPRPTTPTCSRCR